jgi:hypothetical protein
MLAGLCLMATTLAVHVQIVRYSLVRWHCQSDSVAGHAVYPADSLDTGL